MFDSRVGCSRMKIFKFLSSLHKKNIQRFERKTCKKWKARFFITQNDSAEISFCIGIANVASKIWQESWFYLIHDPTLNGECQNAFFRQSTLKQRGAQFEAK